MDGFRRSKGPPDRLIGRLFPSSAITATANLSGPLPELYTAEEATIAAAVPKRRSEFAYGRGCARDALQALGIERCSIPVERDRTPRWPSGTIGSITHCDGFVGAVVGWSHEFAGLGLDAEPATPLDPDLIPRVCTSQDIANLTAIHRDPGIAAKLVFGAKEAVFKAIFPANGTWLDFGDVELDFDADVNTFLVHWAGSHHTRDLPGPNRVTGRYRVTPGHLFSGVTLALP